MTLLHGKIHFYTNNILGKNLENKAYEAWNIFYCVLHFLNSNSLNSLGDTKVKMRKNTMQVLAGRLAFRLLLIIGGALLVFSCQGPLSMTGGKGSVNLTFELPQVANVDLPKAVRAAVASASVASGARFIHPDTQSIQVDVSAPDMSTISVTQTISLGQTSVTIVLKDIPLGKMRKITISMIASDGVTILGQGSTTFDLLVSDDTTLPVLTKPVTALSFGNYFDTILDPSGQTSVISKDLQPGRYLVSLTNNAAMISIYDKDGKSIVSGANQYIVAIPSAGTYYFMFSSVQSSSPNHPLQRI